MQTQWNQEHSGNVFSNVSKNQTLEWIQAFENNWLQKTQNKWIEYKTFELKYEKYKDAKCIKI